MALTPIRRPVLIQQPGNMHTQKAPLPDGSNTFAAGDLVTVSGALGTAVLAAVVTGNTTDANTIAASSTFWGQTPDASKAPADIPPAAFFGENHYCFSLEDAIIEMNITNAAGGVGSGPGTGNGTAGPTAAAVTLGALYALRANATGYVGVQMVDVSTTTASIACLRVVGLAPGQAAGDYNARVLVKIPRNFLIG